MPKPIVQKAKRVYRPYYEWEDYQAGMYRVPKKKKQQKFIDRAKALLTNCGLFYQVGLCIFREWPVATQVNLTNTSANRRAWLGQAACCYMYRVPELMTREAWKQLDEDERQKANEVADRLVSYYEKKN
jgi:hypothetical protein